MCLWRQGRRGRQCQQRSTHDSSRGPLPSNDLENGASLPCATNRNRRNANMERIHGECLRKGTRRLCFRSPYQNAPHTKTPACQFYQAAVVRPVVAAIENAKRKPISDRKPHTQKNVGFPPHSAGSCPQQNMKRVTQTMAATTKKSSPHSTFSAALASMLISPTTSAG